MQRQVVTRDQATGRTTWTYVDRGPAQVTYLRGTPVVPRTAKNAFGNHGRKITGGGAA